MIEINKISKSFNKKKILKEITIKIEDNNICCLLGKNGIGKSTLINIITQTLKQDTGEIIINNVNFNKDSSLIKQKIGLANDSDDLIQELSGFQFLTFRCLIFSIPKILIEERIKSLVNYFFDDTDDIHKNISSYSSGMKMKLRIVASLLHVPEILILDEPFANLDIIAAEKLVLLLNSFSKIGGNIVIVSSHDLLYVEKIATQLCVIDKTEIIFDGSFEDFTKNYSSKIDQSLLNLINPEKITTKNLEWLI